MILRFKVIGGTHVGKIGFWIGMIGDRYVLEFDLGQVEAIHPKYLIEIIG
jgi:hypothetical protein